MGFTSPVGNLVSFISVKPPLVVFTACLAAFAITTYSLAYFIKGAENVPNPDIRLDWNTFMSEMAELDLCLLVSEESKSLNSNHPAESLPSSALAVVRPIVNSSMETSAESMNDDDDIVVSLMVTASLSLMQELSSIPHNISMISGTLEAHLLDLNVEDVPENATLNVAFHLPLGILNASKPQEMCLTFEGPRRLLPLTKSTPSCSPVPSSFKNAQMDSSSVAKFVGQRHEGPSEEVQSPGLEPWCAYGSLLHMTYQPNPNLTVYLTVRDRLVINLHLLHTSYFLFVMAMTMVCYALIRGKPKQKQFSTDMVPLDP